jgi:hypothetical protein
MHQATVRFSSDLWQALEAECRPFAYETALDVAAARIMAALRLPNPNTTTCEPRSAQRSGRHQETSSPHLRWALKASWCSRGRERSAELRRVRTAR